MLLERNIWSCPLELHGCTCRAAQRNGIPVSSVPGISGPSQPPPHPLGTQTLRLCQLLQLCSPSMTLQGTHILHLSFPGMGHHQPWLSLAPSLPELSWTQFTGLKWWNKSQNFSFMRSTPSDFMKVIFLLISEDKWQNNTHLKYKWTAASDQMGSEKRLKQK